MSNTPKNFLGYVQGKKLVGTGSPAVGTQVNIPVHSVNPRNPLNNIYSLMMNKAGFNAIVTRGRNTPSIGFSTSLKTSWCAGSGAGAAILTSLISSFDTNAGSLNDADSWAWHTNDGTTGGSWSDRYFDTCRGAAMSLACSGSGGAISMDYAALAKTGAGSTSFSAYSTDTGSMLDVSQVDFGASPAADLVDGWRVNLLRGEAYSMFFAQSYDPYDVDSGAFGGTLELVQSPQYTLTPGSSLVIRIGPIGSPVLTLTMKVNFDEPVYDMSGGLGRIIRRYTLIDTASGGNPCVFS